VLMSDASCVRKKKMARKARSKRADYERRLEAVRILLLRGEPSGKVCQYAVQAFGVTERQAWRYISDARNAIAGVVNEDRSYLYAEHLATRRMIRARALEEGDLRTALACAQDEAKMFDLYPAQRSEVSGPQGKPQKVVIEVVEYDASRSDASTE